MAQLSRYSGLCESQAFQLRRHTWISTLCNQYSPLQSTAIVNLCVDLDACGWIIDHDCLHHCALVFTERFAVGLDSLQDIIRGDIPLESSYAIGMLGDQSSHLVLGPREDV